MEIVRTIVALGDSTTAGTPGFRSPLESPPAGRGDPESQFAYWMQRRHPEWRVLNRGVNGERSDQIRRRIDRDALAHDPQSVILLAGINDLYQGRPAARIAPELDAMYERLLERRIPTVAATVLPYNEMPPSQATELGTLNGWIRSTAGARGLLFADTARAATEPGDTLRLYQSPDDLHPGVDGYRRMGDALCEVLERAPGITPR